MSAPGVPDRAQAAAQLAARAAWLAGTGCVLSGGVRLIADFVVASRLVATGYPEAALERLLPPQEWGGRRVAVGALLTGLRTPRVRAGELSAVLAAGGRGGQLSAQILTAGTRLDCQALEALITTHSDEVLVPVLHDLLIRFAALDRCAADPERALLHDMVTLAHQAPELSQEQLRAALTRLAQAAAQLGGDRR